MELNIGGDRLVENPAPEDILQAVASLDETPGGFLILGGSEHTYVQCAGDSASGFVLEYQEKDAGRHYLATRKDLAAADIVRTLTLYLEGAEDWKSISAWEPLSY